jgi:hypothetical protein
MGAAAPCCKGQRGAEVANPWSGLAMSDFAAADPTVSATRLRSGTTRRAHP